MKRLPHLALTLAYLAAAGAAFTPQQPQQGPGTREGGQLIAGYKSWTTLTPTIQLVANPGGIGL